jgi:hypothetical protein
MSRRLRHRVGPDERVVRHVEFVFRFWFWFQLGLGFRLCVELGVRGLGSRVGIRIDGK